MPLPQRGLDHAAVLDQLRALGEADLPTHGGRTFAYVYDSGIEDLDDLAFQAYRSFAATNGLDPTAFPSVAAMENDVVGIVADLMSAGPGAAGMVTSGGTESCMLAVKAARDLWRANHPEGGRPQVVLPVTAHAAFAKGAHYFDVEVVSVPVDSTRFTVDAADTVARLSERTALVVVSAPSYAHGVLDPVVSVARGAAAAGVPCHVDGCIGGMLIPYLRRIGVPLGPVEMQVPGVTSISVDLHKYAYTAKGASVLLFADEAMRRHAYYSYSGWPGYPVVNPTMQSTRSAGPLAAAWAVLHAVGDDGYLELARATRQATESLVDRVGDIRGLRVLGEPATSLVAIAGEGDVDPLVVADRMRARGWYLQPQLAFEGLPRNLHLTVTAVSGGRLDALTHDLVGAVDEARASGPAVVDPALAALANELDPGSLTRDQVDGILAFAGMGAADGGSAAPTAAVLALVEALPTRLRDRLLSEYLGRVFTAVRS